MSPKNPKYLNTNPDPKGYNYCVKFLEKRLPIMANIDLTKYGITGTTEIVYNPSYELLFEEETKEGLTGYEVGQVTELDTVNVDRYLYRPFP